MIRGSGWEHESSAQALPPHSARVGRKAFAITLR